MKIRWKDRQGWSVGRMLCPLSALMLAAGMLTAVPALDGMAAGFMDLNEPCSLQILPADPVNTELSEDLAETDIVYDVYQIAKAVEDPGYDTYRYEWNYAGLESEYSRDYTNEQWMELAQKAAELVLEGKVSPTVSAYEEGADLDCGLYLVIARGSGLETYYERVTDDEGNESLVSIAYSQQHIYRFIPSLVSLPGRGAVPGGNTADDAEWEYDLTVTLKPEQAPRYGSLEIVKSLERYETRDPATFVFEVTATLPYRRNDTITTVYSNVISMTFTEADQKSVLLDRIPVGAEVTVKEVYSGAVYTQTAADPDPVTILADDTVQVRFNNDYSEENRGGGSVTNHFSYDGDTWIPEQIYDSDRSGGGQM